MTDNYEIETAKLDHWSSSSLMMFLRNPLAFKKKYLLGIYDEQMSSSAVVGQAGHKAIEAFLNGASVDEATQAGFSYIESRSDGDINYGKTGSREKIIKDYTAAINFYWSEMPRWKGREILGIEQRITEEIEVNGQRMPLPAKAIIDVVWRGEYERLGSGLYITDHKFVRSFTNEDEDDPRYAAQIVQAMFNYHVVLKKYGEAPIAIIYDEVKVGKNKTGYGQLQPRVIEFARVPEHFTFFASIFIDATREATRPDKAYLPNFQDHFDGMNAYLTYRQKIITVDAPIAVHKTEQRVIVEKNFIESAPSKVENANLTVPEKIRLKLQEFGLPVEHAETVAGPTITLYTFRPSRGLKMAQFERSSADIALALKAKAVRVQAPIYGTDTIGIEVPNETRTTVNLDSVARDPGTLILPIGMDVYGQTVKKDLAKMPHLLVAGATGAGKSIFINGCVRALTEQNPSGLKMILIDPKRVELAQFKALPQLLADPIYEEEDAIKALEWLIEEMETRYDKLEKAGVRSIADYSGMEPIVVVIDEFADLVLQNKKQGASRAEKAIVRLAQKSRAVGIHLIIATQRPSVDVVTGILKANLPTRVAFMTSSSTDSQVILDESGAEELIGSGDLLFMDPSDKGLKRLQGFYS